MKRFLVEFGTGADLHGEDCTKAAQKALKDAISHCCMCGLSEIAGIKDMGEVYLKVKIAAPYPEQIEMDKIKNVLPYSDENVEVEVVKGGLEVAGVHVENLGKGTMIVIANAAITVYVKTI